MSGSPNGRHVGKFQARIAIVDGFTGGHHPEFVERFARLASTQWRSVVVLTPEAERMRASMGSLDGIELINYCWPSLAGVSRLHRLYIKAREWRRLGKIVREQKIDAVFLAFADFLLDHLVPASLVKTSLPVPWTGLWFHPMHFRSAKLARRIDFVLLPPERLLRVESCAGIGVLDENIVQSLGRMIPDRYVVPFPDRPNTAAPSLPDRIVEEVRERAAGRRICVLAGSLAPRKGIETLLRASCRLQRDWFFIIVGRITSESPGLNTKLLSDAVSDDIENVWLIPETIPSEAEFNGWIVLADVIFAAYEDFPHSSNILGKAALFEKPVIVTDGYLMAERVRQFGLGLAVPQHNLEALASGLSEIRNLVADGMQFRNGCRSYLDVHSEGAERKAWNGLTVPLGRRADRTVVFDR